MESGSRRMGELIMERREFDELDRQAEAEANAITKLNQLRPEQKSQQLSKRLASNAKKVLEIKL